MTLASPERLLAAPAIDYGDLVITGQEDGRQVHLGALATAVPLEMTMDGTATVTVTVDEQEPGQLKDVLAGFFKPDNAGHLRLAGWNTMPIFGSTYVLSEITRNPAGAWDVVLYDEVSELLKEFTGPLKVSRGDRTRPEVAGMLARQAGVPAWIPGRHDLNLIHNFAPADIKVLRAGRPSKGSDTPILAAVDAAKRAGFRGETLVNMVAISGRETGDTYDPTVQNLKPPDHSIGLWQINQLAVHGKYGTDAQLKDPATNARAAKKMFDAAGYNPWKGASGSWRDGITTARLKRARAAVEKGTDTGGPGGGGTVDRAYVERFEYTVGKSETYWDADARFARDVRWSRFAVFNHLVFAGDLTLAADPTPYELDETDDWVDTPNWTVTRRQRIDEFQLSGRLAAIIPPGAAFNATDDELPTWGTWLNRNFKRLDLLDPECQVEVTLGRPRAPLPEPASTVKARSSSNGGLSGDSGAPSGGGRPLLIHCADVATSKFSLNVHEFGGAPGIPAKYGPVHQVHVAGSYHYSGHAFDASGTEANMSAFAAWVRANHRSDTLELIHNPGTCIKDGRLVNGASVYAAVWAGHRNHVHLAM